MIGVPIDYITVDESHTARKFADFFYGKSKEREISRKATQDLIAVLSGRSPLLETENNPRFIDMYVLQEIIDAMLMVDNPQRMIGLQFYGTAIHDTKNDYRFMVILGALACENQRSSPLEVRFSSPTFTPDEKWMQCLGWARTAASYPEIGPNDRAVHSRLYSGDVNYAFMIANSRTYIVDCYSGNPLQSRSYTTVTLPDLLKLVPDHLPLARSQILLE